MRRLLPFAVLLLAACATTPPPPPRPSPGPVTEPIQPPQTGGLIGRTQAELITRFGAPSFQVREGAGLKLQWQNGSCVLDAYLYPPARGGGLPATAHVDTRRPMTGESVPQESCLTSFAR